MLLALAGLGALPLFILLVAADGDTLTGATGLSPADQLQYIGWVTSLANHGLAATGFDLGSHRHVFVAPVFLLSSLVARAGGSPQLAYLLWLPASAAAVLVAFRSFVNSSLDSRFDRTCALCLALFAVTPLTPVGDWAGLIGGDAWAGFVQVAADASPALQMWGCFPVAVVLALCVGTLMAAERMLTAEADSARLSCLCAGVALLASWTHPWQGMVLIVTLAGLAIVARPGRRAMWLALPMVAAALPLLYYKALPSLDPAWETASHQAELPGGVDTPAMLATVGPLLVAALPALVSRAQTLRGKTLRIWVLATLATFWLGPPHATHVLETLTLPLAILVVAGWRNLPRSKPLLIAFILLMVVPGTVWATEVLYQQTREHRGAYLLRPSDHRALKSIRASAPVGGVLAPVELSTSVPAVADRATWVGHPVWTPVFPFRVAQAERLFDGHISNAGVVRFVRYLHARIVLAPCGSSPRLAAQLEPITERARHFGCATVYVIDATR